MTTLLLWPPRVPPGLADLATAVAGRLGARVEAVEAIDARADAVGLLVVGQDLGEDALADLAAALAGPAPDTVVVVGDDLLGTDGTAPAAAAAGAAAVSLVRSAAVRRDGAVRANVVCVPAELMGRPASQRGALPHAIDSDAVADAVAFLLDQSAGYVRGQVVFVDGGRHLFSSMTS